MSTNLKVNSKQHDRLDDKVRVEGHGRPRSVKQGLRPISLQQDRKDGSRSRRRRRAIQPLQSKFDQLVGHGLPVGSQTLEFEGFGVGGQLGAVGSFEELAQKGTAAFLSNRRIESQAGEEALSNIGKASVTEIDVKRGQRRCGSDETGAPLQVHLSKEIRIVLDDRDRTRRSRGRRGRGDGSQAWSQPRSQPRERGDDWQLSKASGRGQSSLYIGSRLLGIGRIRRTLCDFVGFDDWALCDIVGCSRSALDDFVGNDFRTGVDARFRRDNTAGCRRRRWSPDELVLRFEMRKLGFEFAILE
jgi:hypothetical protein